MGKVTRYINKHGGFFGALHYFFKTVGEHGMLSVFLRIFGIDHGAGKDYRMYIKNVEKKYSENEVEQMLTTMKIKPVISFIIPVYNVGEVYLRECLDAIINQYYPHWEICIADDASTEPHIPIVLNEYVEKYDNIKVLYRKENGHISEASNSALTLATGEYIAHMDNDDFIEPEALLEIVKMINEHPDADMIYTDEDKVNMDGTERREPFFKPAWSPDSILCHMYVTHLGIYRRQILEEIGGFDSAFNGSQDYEMLLRFSEKTTNIYHVPQIMYHWRMLPTSAASGMDVKDYAFIAGVKGKKDAMKRRGIDAKVEVVESIGATNIVYTPKPSTFVSIIISGENVDAVSRTLRSINETQTPYKLEILLTGHFSENECKDLCAISHYRITTIMPQSCETRTLNFAVSKSKGNVLCFLGEDITISQENWLDRLVGQAQQTHTGAVGAKIVYPNRAVCNAGLHYLSEKPVFAYHQWHADDSGYHGRLRLNYNYLAISQLCLVIEKSTLSSVNGFDESLVNDYFDMDLGIKLYESDLFNVTRGDVEMVFNGKSKRHKVATNDKTEKQDLLTLNQKWLPKYTYDPFYNPNFKQNSGDYSLQTKAKGSN